MSETRYKPGDLLTFGPEEENIWFYIYVRDEARTPWMQAEVYLLKCLCLQTGTFVDLSTAWKSIKLYVANKV